MGHLSAWLFYAWNRHRLNTLRRNYPRVKTTSASAKQWPWPRRNAADRGFSCGVDGYCVTFATICSASVSLRIRLFHFFFMPRYLCRGWLSGFHVIELKSKQKRKLISVFDGDILCFFNGVPEEVHSREWILKIRFNYRNIELIFIGEREIRRRLLRKGLNVSWNVLFYEEEFEKEYRDTGQKVCGMFFVFWYR